MGEGDVSRRLPFTLNPSGLDLAVGASRGEYCVPASTVFVTAGEDTPCVEVERGLLLGLDKGTGDWVD